jgi:serine/threonine-protein kinase
MGAVQLAVSEGAHGVRKLVVLKTLLPHVADGHAHEMFTNEARIAARLDHRNIVRTYGATEIGGELVIVMEFLRGYSLAELLRHEERGALEFPLPVKIRILVDALSGLHHAHALKDFDGRPLLIVHRDLSPGNIFVTIEGDAKVLDFGIAKMRDAAGMTRSGEVKGKPHFMAPEQFSGAPVDARTDVFAAGAILWQMLVGEPLHRGLGPFAIASRVRDGAIEPPARGPIELRAICVKALDARPDRRFADAAAMRAALLEWLDRDQRVTTDAIADLVRRLPARWEQCEALAAAHERAASSRRIALVPPPRERTVALARLDAVEPPLATDLSEVVQLDRERTPAPRGPRIALPISALVIVIAGVVLFARSRASSPPAGHVETVEPARTSKVATATSATALVEPAPVDGFDRAPSTSAAASSPPAVAAESTAARPQPPRTKPKVVRSPKPGSPATIPTIDPTDPGYD